jgi:hypothetical protein
MARSNLLVGLMAAALPVTGCWVVIGESFDGYSRRGDGGAGLDGGSLDGDVKDGDAAPLGFGSTPHQVGACMPHFTVANGIGYPSEVPAPIRIADSDGVNTDTDPRCFKTSPPLPYCLLFASTFEIAPTGYLGTEGSRPLAIVAVDDLIINGNLDVAGADGPGNPGPGSHSAGAAPKFGGGGGNAEPGADGCGQSGGAAIAVPTLVGGGNGGGTSDPNPACQRGGGGGGAVQLVSLCGAVRIPRPGNINASGGGGSGTDDALCPLGFGGGAGGTVWVQAGDFTFDGVGGATLHLFGGGGGGGSCRDTAASAWTGVTTGDRDNGKAGAACGSGATGGTGGIGGRLGNPPVSGAAGTPSTGEATCGGGGGGRGRIVIQTPTADCANYPFASVSCVAKKLTQ